MGKSEARGSTQPTPRTSGDRLATLSAVTVEAAGGTAVDGGGRSAGPVFAAGALWSVGILIGNILSIVFQATQHSRGVSESDLGTLGAALVLGRAIMIATAPVWVYRTSPRWVTASSLSATVVALLAIASLLPSPQLAYGWFAVGLASGCFATPAYTALGNAQDPVRAYSNALFGASLLAALVAYLLPAFVIPHYGETGALLVIAAIFLASLPCAFMLRDAQFVGHKHSPSPAPQQTALSVPTARSGRIVAPLLAAVAGAAFIGVVMGGVSSFIASIATANGIGPQAVGLFVALGLIATLAGTLVPSFVKGRLSPVTMIGIGTGGTLASYFAMTSASTWIFGTGFVVYAFFATIGYVYYLGIVRALDFTDRIYVAYPAMDALAFAASAELAGRLLSRSAPITLFLLSGLVLALCWVIVAAAQRLADTPPRGREAGRQQVAAATPSCIEDSAPLPGGSDPWRDL